MSKLNMIPRDAREVYCNEEGEPIAFCPKESIGLTDVMRAQFYLLNKERLAQLAKRAKEKGPTFGVICIDVCEPHGGIVHHERYKDAADFLSHPEEWCPVCQGDDQEEN